MAQLIRLLSNPSRARPPGSVDPPKTAHVSWRQWQDGTNRFKELRRRVVQKFLAAVAAGSPTGFWRMSGHPAVQMALRNHAFDSLGLPQLYVPVEAQPVEPPRYLTPMPGGVGGAAP